MHRKSVGQTKRIVMLSTTLLYGCLLPDVTDQAPSVPDPMPPPVGMTDASPEANPGSSGAPGSSADATGTREPAQPPSGPMSPGPNEVSPLNQCYPACAHGTCRALSNTLKCDCAGSGFKGNTCDEPDPCQLDNGGCEQICISDQDIVKCACDSGGTLQPNGKSCVVWQTRQVLNTLYRNGLEPRIAFGLDGSVLAKWIAPTKATESVYPNGMRGVLYEDFQLASARYDPVGGWNDLAAESAANGACVQLSRINARGEALAVLVESSDDRANVKAQRFSAGVWSVLTTLPSQPSDTVRAACAIAIDDRGDGLLTVSTNTGLLAARFTPAGGWEPLTHVEGFPSASGANQMVLDAQPSGDALLIVESDLRDGFAAGTFSSDQGWSTSVMRYPNPGTKPKVAMSANGDSIVVWRLEQKIQAIHHSRSRGWGAVEDIGDLGEFGERYGHDVAINGNGQAWAVFVKTTHSPFSSVWARPYTPETSWGPPVQISEEFIQAWIDSPGVAIDETGNVIVGWRREGFGQEQQIGGNRFSATAGWLGPVALSMENLGYPSSIQVGFDAMSTPIAVWATSLDSASLWVSRWE